MLHRRLAITAIVSTAALLTACATTPVPQTGFTYAQGNLGIGLARNVANVAKIYVKCDQVDSINTSVEEMRMTPPGATGGLGGVDRIIEIWTANLCGMQVPIRVALEPVASGGTNVSIQALKPLPASK